VVSARYTNGQAIALGQIAMTNFSNTQGLQKLGDTAWAETSESGAAQRGAPGSANLGLLQAGALEASNVDITEQLVEMINAQRNFQANAQMISTADQITQTVINIR
jgi:flagellar hook protein FlgE